MKLRKPYPLVFLLGFSILTLRIVLAVERGEELEVTVENYPRALYFRQSEATHTHASYEEWEDRFDDLQGFIGQALPYQLSDHHYRSIELHKNPEYFTRFKERHPGQMILLHLNTNDQDPRNPGEDFHPGHWLYFEGARIVSDVPDLPAAYERFSDLITTEIQVSDASVFSTDIGLRRSCKDDIGLCMLDSNGKPNWNESEQVTLVSVDYDRNTISVRRGLYGSKPRAFPAGRAYAAAHVGGGPWRGDGFLQWHYNYSTGCPRDEKGRNCSDMVVKYLAGVIGPDGPLHNIDGVTLDVMWNQPDLRGNRTPRLPDFDADGKGDDFRTDTSYATGMIEFLRDLKEEFGDDKFVVADGYRLNNQRAFGIINGCESEGWPTRNDYRVDNWSGGLNKMLFWHENSRAPKLNYINHAYGIVRYSDIGTHHVRLVLAATVLTDAVYVLSAAGPPGTPSRVLRYTPDPEDDYGDIWDEIVMGRERKIGWLGQPLGPAVRMARHATDALGGDGAPPNERLLKRLEGDDARIAFESDRVKVESTTSSEIRFELTDLACDGPELTVLVSARAMPRQGYPSEYARLMVASVDKGLPFPSPLAVEISERNRFESFVNQNEFTSGFFFRDLNQDRVDVEFSVEGPEPIWIAGLEAYCHADAMYRQFEDGLVLANPSDHPYTFDLAGLFPDEQFRRIQGSPDQDPEANDGSPVNGKVRLQGRDGLFLVKIR
jgi:hypothetical protein